jgi:hypothetical protein
MIHGIMVLNIYLMDAFNIPHDRIHFPTNECFSHKKTTVDREYSFEILMQFSKGGRN